MQCGVNDTNYRCSDFTAHFNSGTEMCKTFFPEQLMGNDIIDVARQGPCIIPGGDQPIYLGYIYWFDRSFDPWHKASLMNPLLLQNLRKRAILKLNIGIISKLLSSRVSRTGRLPFYPEKFWNDHKGIFYLLAIAVNGGSGGIYFWLYWVLSCSSLLLVEPSCFSPRGLRVLKDRDLLSLWNRTVVK